MDSTNKKKHPLRLSDAVQPLIESGVTFREQRMLLHEMFTASVANAPDNEVDNFTAKRLTPVYLALIETLENLDSIHGIHSANIQASMFHYLK